MSVKVQEASYKHQRSSLLMSREGTELVFITKEEEVSEALPVTNIKCGD